MTDLRNYQMLTYIDEDIILSTLPPSFAAGGVTRRRRRDPDAESGYDRFMSSPLAAAVLSVIVGLGLVIGLVALGRSEGPVTPAGSVAESESPRETEPDGTEIESPSETEGGTWDGRDEIDLPEIWLAPTTPPALPEGATVVAETEYPCEFWEDGHALAGAFLRVCELILPARDSAHPATRAIYIDVSANETGRIYDQRLYYGHVLPVLRNINGFQWAILRAEPLLDLEQERVGFSYTGSVLTYDVDEAGVWDFQESVLLDISGYEEDSREVNGYYRKHIALLENSLLGGPSGNMDVSIHSSPLFASYQQAIVRPVTSPELVAEFMRMYSPEDLIRIYTEALAQASPFS